jgi:hypothetical protein
MENYRTITSNSNMYPESFIQQQTHYLDPQELTKAKTITNK